MTLAERLKEVAADSGSVLSLSKICNIPHRTLASWTEGTSPSATELSKVADAAGVSLDWLIAGVGPKKRGETPEKSTSESTLKEDGPQWDSPSAALAQQMAGILYRLIKQEGIYSEMTPQLFDKVLDLMYGLEMEGHEKAAVEGTAPPKPEIERYRSIIKMTRR